VIINGATFIRGNTNAGQFFMLDQASNQMNKVVGSWYEIENAGSLQTVTNGISTNYCGTAFTR
jgi:hypothetical protein